MIKIRSMDRHWWRCWVPETLCRLDGNSLEGADLRNACLDRADLRGACLCGANLRQTELRGANLKKTDLTGANLRHADLRGARLVEANLGGADLRYAELAGADLVGAQFDLNTQWPAQFRPELRGAVRRGGQAGPAEVHQVTIHGPRVKRL